MHNSETADSLSAEHFFDISNMKLLVGRAALQEYLKSSHSSENIYNLRHLLRNSEIEIPKNEEKSEIDYSKKQLLEYGRWICNVAGKGDECQPQQRDLNSSVLYRANKLGLGPSLWAITKKQNFGTLSKFYSELGVSSAKRHGAFDDWTHEDFGNYIRQVAKELGKKPSRKDLAENSKRSVKYPSLNVIISRMGSLGNVYELGGFPNINSWEREDYISWGIRFMKANDGIVPTQSLIDYFSKQKQCASAKTFASHFDMSLNNYKQELIDEYAREAWENEENLKKKLDIIESGKLPIELFENATSDGQRIIRYAKYIVLDELIAGNFQHSKVSIAKMNNDQGLSVGFVRSIRRINGAITVGDIESTALYLGVFDDIWPPDQSYLDTLKIPSSHMPKRVQQISLAVSETN